MKDLYALLYNEDKELKTMNDKIICEKCGAEMVPIDPNKPVGMTCPNCGWGWATTYIDPVFEDPSIYEITIDAGNFASTTNIKAVSKIAGVNYIEAKRMIENAPSIILSGMAIKIKDAIKILSCASMDFTITPDFPYTKE